MYDLADYRSLKNRKHVQDSPVGILDVIESDYPCQYSLLLDNQSLMATLFSKEEWIDILTKSRNSYKDHIQRLDLSREIMVRKI
ncbi:MULTISPECIES: hypothetical protein [Desulfosporosinus]|uniref:Uncharacterized protein n=1 Tax=Desulfosporosinus acididurans TaxID=476652 RepID=A0A0J1IIM7_9FIRM|nr:MULTISPECIES: hypothetical protein [Desulfosporosinus]KLU64586.1 hypothetical protein DEAC_c35320 [Desulfosporosinus acididurans]